MTDTVPERVARGMAWLDANEPGWERRIDLAALEMADGCRCILGQVFQAEARNADVIGKYRGDDDQWLTDAYNWVRDNRSGELRNYPDEYGFTIAGIDDDERAVEWVQLDSTWIAAVKDRFDTGTLSG